jgi:hypothetical protein
MVKITYQGGMYQSFQRYIRLAKHFSAKMKEFVITAFYVSYFGGKENNKSHFNLKRPVEIAEVLKLTPHSVRYSEVNPLPEHHAVKSGQEERR